MSAKRKKKRIILLWEKHPECNEEYCFEGYVFKHCNSLCGGSGVRKTYCQKCCELWERDCTALYEKKEGKPPKRILSFVFSPEEMMQYIKKNKE